MWRFILMTFAFLGWSFYTLSGGADYQPREGSRQAEALKARATADLRVAASQPAVADTATPGAQDSATPGAQNTVTRNTLDLAGITPGFAANARSANPLLQQASAPDQVQTASFGGGSPGVILAKPAAIAQAAVIVPAVPESQPEPQKDLRQVTGNSVNMRAGPGTTFGILAKVTRGTEVEVLEDFGNGWLRLRVLETNRVGWISGTLISGAQG